MLPGILPIDLVFRKGKKNKVKIVLINFKKALDK